MQPPLDVLEENQNLFKIQILSHFHFKQLGGVKLH